MIRRKTIDFKRELSGEKSVPVSGPSPAILRDSEFENLPDFESQIQKCSQIQPDVESQGSHSSQKADFLEVVKQVGKSGKRFPVSMAPLVEKKDYSSYATGVFLTTKQVQRLFAVTSMTLYHWVKKYGMPKQVFGAGKNPPVRYDEGMLLAWAAEFNRPVVHTDYLEWQ